MDWLQRPQECVRSDDKHSYFTYSIRVNNGKRDELAHYLFDEGIYTTLRYHPLHMNALYGQMDKSLPNSEQLNEDCLSLPLHPSLSEEDIEKIVAAVKAFA